MRIFNSVYLYIIGYIIYRRVNFFFKKVKYNCISTKFIKTEQNKCYTYKYTFI